MHKFWMVAGLAMLTGCSLDATFDPPLQYQWHGELVGNPGWEELEGDAGFIWTAGRGQFQAGIQLRKDEQFAQRQWHIHQGTCEEGGPVVGLPSEYLSLIIGPDGEAEVNVLIGEPLNPNRSYYVDVHVSDATSAAVIACANTEMRSSE